MKKHVQYIPITAFAASIAFSGSLSAADNTAQGHNMTKQQGQSEVNVRNLNKSTSVSTTYRANSHSKPMAASDVLGMNIDSSDNEKIGEIDEIFVDSDSGKVVAVVVSTGGFLGMGQNQTLIAPEDLRFNDDRTRFQSDLSKDQIRTAPRYKSGDTSELHNVRPLGKSAWDRDSDQDQTASNRSPYMNKSDEHTNQAEGDQSLGQGLAVSDLIGMSVENRQGESIGDVDEVFLDLENKKVAGVVVSTGGFLGMGDRKSIFGVSELTISHKDEAIVLDYNRDQMRAFPEYKKDDQSVFSDLNERTDRLASRNSGQSTRSQNENARSRSENARSQDDNARNRSENALGQRENDRTRTESRSSDMTVFDQGNSSEEIAMTGSIRTAIRDDDSLSSRANNVTIITKDGKVVLRGEKIKDTHSFESL